MILCIYKKDKNINSRWVRWCWYFRNSVSKNNGCYCFTTTASEAGTNLVTSLGADRIINYKTEKFEEILKNYDAVFDTIGGTTRKNHSIL